MLDIEELEKISTLENPLESINQKMINLLDKDDENYGKKSCIIQNLPDTFVQDVVSCLDKENFRSDFNKDRRLHGIVFETLVKQEFPSENPIAEDLLKVVQDPKGLGLDQYLGIQKNPDITYVEVDDKSHRVIIKGAADAKFGRLGKHAFNQIKDSGFKKTFKRIAQRIPLLSSASLSKLGLSNLAKVSRLGMDVSEGFTQVLIFPSDTEVSNKYCLIDSKELERYEVDLLFNLLNQKDVEVTTSCFSHKDIENICGLLKSSLRDE